jgi:chromosome segregation ATPase
LILLLGTMAHGQTDPLDSQRLQTLVDEVRQLRQDLKSMAAASARAQILLFRLQIQEGVMSRAQQRLDDARTKLSEAQAGNKQQTATIKRMEDNLASGKNEAEQKQLEQVLSEFKRRLETMASEEESRQARVTECEEQLRLEQAKLSDLEGELDQLDKASKEAPAH